MNMMAALLCKHRSLPLICWHFCLIVLLRHIGISCRTYIVYTAIASVTATCHSYLQHKLTAQKSHTLLILCTHLLYNNM